MRVFPPALPASCSGRYFNSILRHLAASHPVPLSCLNSTLNPRMGHPPAESAPAGLGARGEEWVIGGPSTSTRGRRRCRVTGWLALALPPTWGLATPPTLPRPRAASPAKSLVDSQSWSMTVNSTQAPRRRQASAGTELRGERGGGWLSGALLPTPGRQGGEGHSQVEELVVHGVQRPALDLGPLAADQREKVRRAQLHDHKGVA